MLDAGIRNFAENTKLPKLQEVVAYTRLIRLIIQNERLLKLIKSLSLANLLHISQIGRCLF